MILPAGGSAEGRGLRVAVVTLGEEEGVAAAGAEVARRLGRSGAVATVTRPRASRATRERRDPFGLERRVGAWEADAVVVVAPTRWGPRRIVPGPVVAGRPLGLIQADAPGDLPPDGPGGPPHGLPPRAPWVVAAMAKDVFLEPTDHWASTLAAAGRPAVDVRADRARREDLVEALRAGPGVVLYAGHGRTRGWSGYQGLRWRHLRPDGPDDRPDDGLDGAPDASRPAGLVFAFACDTLSRSRSRVPFGTRLVAGGVVRAYLGAAGSIRTADAEVLAEIVLGELARRAGPQTLVELLRLVDRSVAGEPAARRAWRGFRLLGDPTVELAGARPSRGAEEPSARAPS